MKLIAAVILLASTFTLAQAAPEGGGGATIKYVCLNKDATGLSEKYNLYLIVASPGVPVEKLIVQADLWLGTCFDAAKGWNAALGK